MLKPYSDFSPRDTKNMLPTAALNPALLWYTRFLTNFALLQVSTRISKHIMRYHVCTYAAIGLKYPWAVCIAIGWSGEGRYWGWGVFLAHMGLIISGYAPAQADKDILYGDLLLHD